MTITEHAAHDAANAIRSGRSPALAVFTAAESYGLSTRDVSLELRSRRRAAKQAIVTRRAVRRWWED